MVPKSHTLSDYRELHDYSCKHVSGRSSHRLQLSWASASATAGHHYHHYHQLTHLLKFSRDCLPGGLYMNEIGPDQFGTVRHISLWWRLSRAPSNPVSSALGDPSSSSPSLSSSVLPFFSFSLSLSLSLSLSSLRFFLSDCQTAFLTFCYPLFHALPLFLSFVYPLTRRQQYRRHLLQQHLKAVVSGWWGCSAVHHSSQ